MVQHFKKRLAPTEPELVKSFNNKLLILKDTIDISKLGKRPTIIQADSSFRDSICYFMSVLLSNQEGRTLDIAAATARNLFNQHFLKDAERDINQYNKMYYSDLSFVFTSQHDFSTEIMESIIIDFLEFRHVEKNYTVIIYDHPDLRKNRFQSKLEEYFKSYNYNIINLFSSKQNTTRSNIVVKPKNKKKQTILEKERLGKNS